MGKSKRLDEAITSNGFGHFQVTSCHLRLIPAAFFKIPRIPRLCFSDVSDPPLFQMILVGGDATA